MQSREVPSGQCSSVFRSLSNGENGGVVLGKDGA